MVHIVRSWRFPINLQYVVLSFTRSGEIIFVWTLYVNMQHMGFASRFVKVYIISEFCDIFFECAFINVIIGNPNSATIKWHCTWCIILIWLKQNWVVHHSGAEAGIFWWNYTHTMAGTEYLQRLFWMCWVKWICVLREVGYQPTAPAQREEMKKHVFVNHKYSFQYSERKICFFGLSS